LRNDIAEVEALINKQKGAEALFYGLDIGRVQDYSTLSISVRYILPIGTTINSLLSKYYCVYLKRYPLQTPYEVIEDDCAMWWKWADEINLTRHFVADMTGVGAPVVEGLKKRGVRCTGVVITGGHQESNPAIGEYHVPKATLATQLVRTAQMGRFQIYKSMQFAAEFKEELGNFGYDQNKMTGAISYEALDERIHDDLVISVALPVWFGERVMQHEIKIKGGTTATVEDRDYNPLYPENGN